MGDRTYLGLYCHRNDANALASQLDLVIDEGWDDPVTALLFREEANYGLLSERQQAAKGLQFHGSHEQGCEYGAALFVAFDGEHVDVSNADGEPCVHVSRSGPSEDELAEVRRYYTLLDALEEHWKSIPVALTPAAP